jgi:hypothetical protein
MSEERDRRVLQHYAAANAALDEAPGEVARAAILAAAARAAGARPQPVGRLRRWRLPLAAAASLLVGAIAVIMATRIDESPSEDKTTVAPVAVAPPAAAPATRSEASSVAAPPPAAEQASSPKVGAATSEPRKPQRPAPASSARNEGRQKSAPDAAAGRDAAAETAATPVAQVGKTVESTEAAPQAAPPAAGVRKDEAMADARQAAEAEAGKRGEIGEARPHAAAPSTSGLRKGETTAGARVAAAPEAAAPAPWRATPEEWIERIVKLRAEGRNDEADVELALLRKRHPDLRLPPAALPTPGR